MLPESCSWEQSLCPAAQQLSDPLRFLVGKIQCHVRILIAIWNTNKALDTSPTPLLDVPSPTPSQRPLSARACSSKPQYIYVNKQTFAPFFSVPKIAPLLIIDKRAKTRINLMIERGPPAAGPTDTTLEMTRMIDQSNLNVTRTAGSKAAPRVFFFR